MALSGHAEQGGLLDFASVRDRVASSLTSRTETADGMCQSALAEEGVLAPALQKLMSDIKQKKTLPSSDMSVGDGEGLAAELHLEASVPNKHRANDDPSWCDVGKVAKAQRETDWALTNFHKDAKR